MRTADIFLFGGPLLLGVVGWTAGWLSIRADRARRQNPRPEAAE